MRNTLTDIQRQGMKMDDHSRHVARLTEQMNAMSVAWTASSSDIKTIAESVQSIDETQNAHDVSIEMITQRQLEIRTKLSQLQANVTNIETFLRDVEPMLSKLRFAGDVKDYVNNNAFRPASPTSPVHQHIYG